MGCAPSTGGAIIVDQNGNPPHTHHPQKQAVMHPQPVRQHVAHPSVQHQAAPTHQPVAPNHQPMAPTHQPVAPVHQPGPPANQTAAPVQNRAPPPPDPPKEPTAPPPAPPQPAEDVNVEQTSPVENRDEEKLTAEIMNEFIEIEKQIQNLEKMQHEERLMFFKFESKNTEDSLKAKQEELKVAHQVALKEYADCENFNIQEYMASNQTSYLSSQQADAAFNKEKQEYLEAKNKLDSCQKEVEELQSELTSISEKMNDTKAKVDELYKLQDKQDGLLENVFHGDYGSEKEEKLENEFEVLREKRDRCVLAAMRWKTAKDMLSKACSQLAYSTARWNQIQKFPNIPNQAKFYMATETRNALIAGHMNARHVAEQLQSTLPYWNNEDDKNLVMSINIIYNDVTSKSNFDRALAWYKYYHWRMALSLNWVEQVLSQLHQQLNSAEKDQKTKYHELKLERLKCIQEKVKEALGIDISIDEFIQEQNTEDENSDSFDFTATVFSVDNSKDVQNMDEMPAATESENPTSLEVIAAAEEMNKPDAEAGGEEKLSEEKLSEETPAEETPAEETPAEEKPAAGEEEQQAAAEDDKPKAPPIRNIPLDELAPIPSHEELIGKVEKLLESVEMAEESLERNKLRQEQNLQEQLRRRRSKRRKMRDQTKQTSSEVKPLEAVPE